jgi:hypothetical protein
LLDPDYDQIPAVVERSRLRVKNFYADLDARLTALPYVAGDHFSAADITGDADLGRSVVQLPSQVSGQPEQALELGKRSTALYTEWDTTYWLLVPVHVQLGHLAEARRTRQARFAFTRIDDLRCSAVPPDPKSRGFGHDPRQFQDGWPAGLIFLAAG